MTATTITKTVREKIAIKSIFLRSGSRTFQSIITGIETTSFISVSYSILKERLTKAIGNHVGGTITIEGVVDPLDRSLRGAICFLVSALEALARGRHTQDVFDRAKGALVANIGNTGDPSKDSEDKHEPPPDLLISDIRA